MSAYLQCDFDAEIERHLLSSGSRGIEILPALRNAPEQPPVTTDTLAELDMLRLINNSQLRHDVNFDRELYLRPNLDRAQEEQATKSANDYWEALEAELFILQLSQHARARLDDAKPANLNYWESLVQAGRKRLPGIFKNLRDVAIDLVPAQDRCRIMERLDVDLLLQQIDHSVCDLVDLITWLGSILKSHCAPIRDVLVDRMRDTICKGVHQADRKLIVGGLRQLFTLLEAMKLDIANHQIKLLRLPLIADTVNFQKRHNAYRIRLGRLEPHVSRSWLSQEHEILSLNKGLSPTYLDALIHGVLRNLLFCSSTTSLTFTFYHDLVRLSTIRVDLHNLICHCICCEILLHMLDPGISRCGVPKALSKLRTSLTAIVGSQGLWIEHIGSIATEIVRTMLVLEGRSRLYDADLTALVERKLRVDLNNTSSAFCMLAGDALNRLFLKIRTCVEAHHTLQPIDLQEAFVPMVPARSTQLSDRATISEPVIAATFVDPDVDLVCRLSHIIVLHWQVWADSVYLVELR